MTAAVQQDDYLELKREEMRRAGLYDNDADFRGMIPECVLELLDTWHKQGHSGGSAYMTLEIFNKLVAHKPLTPITDDPDEWMDMSEYQGGEPLWQCRRQPTLFSLDGGKTYYDLNEYRPRWRLWLGKLGFGYHGFRFHESAFAHDVSGRA